MRINICRQSGSRCAKLRFTRRLILVKVNHGENTDLSALIFTAIKGGCRKSMRQPLSMSKKAYRFVKIHKNNLVNWTALRPRGPFLFRSAGKGSKRGRCARHCGSGKMEAREKLFGEPFQTQRLTAFQTHGKVRFCPSVKNSLTSHADNCCGCCLGLPSAVTLIKAGCENCVAVKLTGCAATFYMQK